MGRIPHQGNTSSAEFLPVPGLRWTRLPSLAEGCPHGDSFYRHGAGEHHGRHPALIGQLDYARRVYTITKTARSSISIFVTTN